MEKGIGTYLIAIVALVAVVGLVLMFTGQSNDSAYIVDEDGNIVGEAFRFNNYWKPLERLEAEPSAEELQEIAQTQSSGAGFGVESAGGCESGTFACGTNSGRCCITGEQECRASRCYPID